MKKRILTLLEERIEEKRERIKQLEADKHIYRSNARYGSYQSVSEDAIKRANKAIRRLEKEIKRLISISDRLE